MNLLETEIRNATRRLYFTATMGDCPGQPRWIAEHAIYNVLPFCNPDFEDVFQFIKWSSDELHFLFRTSKGRMDLMVRTGEQTKMVMSCERSGYVR